MSEQPPPPPESNWPTPTAPPPSAGGADGGDGRRKWWTGGRVVAAIVIVLVLMGGAGFAGFLAGAAWSGFESVAGEMTEDITEDITEDDSFDDAADDFPEDTGGTDETDDTDGSEDTGGTDEADAAAGDDETLRVGSTVTGTLSDDAVEHLLVVESAGEVTVELRSDDFDTTLTLLDEDGEELAYNDDIEFGEDRNSRVEVALSAGTYTVVVDVFGFDEGSYELSATS